jgi:hypothetical protein
MQMHIHYLLNSSFIQIEPAHFGIISGKAYKPFFDGLGRNGGTGNNRSLLSG